MKIVHVIHTFPPFSRAGSENYLEALARCQARHHRVDLFHRIGDPERPEYEVTRDRVGHLPVTRVNRTFRDVESFADTYDCPGVEQAFAEFLDRTRPDIVHFHHTTCLSLGCVDVAKDRGIPVVYTLHDFWLICQRGQLLRRDLDLCTAHGPADCVRCLAYHLPIEGGHERVEALWQRAEELRRWPLPEPLRRRLASRPFAAEAEAMAAVKRRDQRVKSMLARVDRFIAPSRFIARQYRAFGVRRRQVTVSDYGFDLDPWREPAPRSSSDKLRVVYLGTWIPSKGVHVLIEAFRELDPDRTQLDIHGYAVPFDGVEDYEGQLRRLAGNAPHIHFRSAYEPEDVPALLAEADVLVVPSIWYENSPLTIHEAYLAGIPVVGSGHGGMAELIHHGISGLTYRPGDPRALRRALRRLIDEPGLLEQLSLGIPEIKSIDDESRKIETLYGALLDRDEAATLRPIAGSRAGEVGR